MLQHLSVKNYALIQQLDLEFKSGFSVITGETGAGKSILLGALGLILGKRADLKALRDPEKKCVVEGSFVLNADRFRSYFEDNDLDFENPSIIRREILPSGKSRAFVNDTPVRLTVLAELADRLIDVHSQHQNLLLADHRFQLELIDSFVEDNQQLEAYQKLYGERRDILKKIEQLQQTTNNQLNDIDYLRFLYNELNEANLRAGEQEEIEEELKLLSSSEEISENLAAALGKLNDENGLGAMNQLAAVKGRMQQLARLHPDFEDISSRFNSLQIELEDLERELQSKTDWVEHDPEKLGKLDTRLSLLIHLQKKNKAENLGELISKRDELEAQLEMLENLDGKKEQLQQELDNKEQELSKQAARLTQLREKAANGIEKQISAVLQKLNMADASLKIELRPTAEFSSYGKDEIVFSFAANRGSQAQPLNKVASGGEMSRVMLALKSSMAQKSELPSIIFDEIDTGVSGETAGKIGDILKGMGQKMQVIAISHLPQIASQGANHFKVEKTSDEHHTYTSISQLNDDERVSELARLLSGAVVTPAALANAKNLLAQN